MTRASAARKARKGVPAARQGNGLKPAGMQPAGAVFIAIPTYDGKIDGALTESLVKEIPLLLGQRWIVGFGRLEHNAIIASARNLLCDRFLTDWWEWDGARRAYTDLLFIDADVSFERGAILRILQHDVDVVFGAPPMKTEPECYPCEFARDADGSARPDPQTGLLAMTYGPAGFLRIRRGTLERLRDEGKAPEVVDRNHDGVELKRYRAYFHVGHVGTRYIGEDVWFFENWRNIGGTVWMDPALAFDHMGSKRWRGNVGEFLMAQMAEERDRAETERRLAEAPRGAGAEPLRQENRA